MESYMQGIIAVIVCTIAFFKASGQITKRVDDLTETLRGIREDLNAVMIKLTTMEHTYATKEELNDLSKNVNR